MAQALEMQNQAAATNYGYKHATFEKKSGKKNALRPITREGLFISLKELRRAFFIPAHAHELSVVPRWGTLGLLQKPLHHKGDSAEFALGLKSITVLLRGSGGC